MRAVQIAELKNRLSAYLNLVRAGQEIVIRDRKMPIAKIVPLNHDEIDAEEQELVAAGILRLPSKPMDFEKFWNIGRGIRIPKIDKAVLARAMDFAREDLDVSSILGRKRRPARLRAAATKKSR